MSDQAPGAFASLLGLIMTRPITGVRLGMSATPVGEEPALLPQFEERVWQLDAASEDIPALPAELVNSGVQGSLFIEALTSPRASQRWTEAEGLRGNAAFIWRTLSSMPAGTEVAVLTTANVATIASQSSLRRLLAEQYTIRWLIYLNNHHEVFPSIPSGIPLLLLMITVGRSAEATRLIRLLDLRHCPTEEWPQEVSQAKKRGGGEVGRSVVLRDHSLSKEPWTYERFTKAFQESRRDAESLGHLLSLSELVESIVLGASIQRGAILERSDDDDAPPKEHVSLLTGRDLQRDGAIGVPQIGIPLTLVNERNRALAGDVLIGRLMPNDVSGPRIRAVTVPDGMDAAFSDKLLRLRWKPSIPAHVRELLVAWLNSRRAVESLLAQGAISTLGDNGLLTIAALRELEVPYPSERVVQALGELAELESWYHARATHVRSARQVIFEAERYAEVVSMLLESHQAERERVSAAENSQRFDYRVRNYYPHPIALRREQILVMEHGKARIEAIIECAEHLQHYLAVLGIFQLGRIDPTKPLPDILLGKLSLRFDWGTSSSVLMSAAAATAKQKDPLALPFPQLEFLHDRTSERVKAFHEAGNRLRSWRNAHSHLHRQPESELVATSKEFGAALDKILEAVSFLTDLPLVRVRDYSMSELGDSRQAEFEYIRGASSVFEVREQLVDQELPRGSLGVLPRDRTFVSLAPWLLWRTCDVCKRFEVFVFNRFEDGQVTYVAMESGHPWKSDAFAGRFRQLINAASAS